jgi:serine protease inhibitor
MKGITADDSQTYKFESGETSAPTSYTSYKNAIGDFSFKMLSSLYKSGDNTAFSSAGIFTQLGILEMASNGDNYKEIKNLLGKNLSKDALLQCSGYFLARLSALSNKDENYYIDINNNLFLNSDLIVSNSFLVGNADYFNQGLFRLDYEDENSLTKINSYIKESSDKNSSDIISSLDKSAEITSLGTAFMKDKWLEGYSNDSISSGTFKGIDGDVKTNFMESIEYYIEGKNCTGFIKDFKSTPCRFIALLPNDNLSAYELAKSLDYEGYSDIIDTMSVFKTCTAYLPQFSVSNTLSFKEVLSKNNVDIMFTPEADFSNISYNAKGSVSDIVQSFELKVTQGGVGTTKVNSSSSTKKEPDTTVKLSKPFIFIIADNESNIPIYIGIISNI